MMMKMEKLATEKRRIYMVTDNIRLKLLLIWHQGDTLTNMNYFNPSQYGQVVTSITMCGIRLRIHSQTSTMQPLKIKGG